MGLFLTVIVLSSIEILLSAQDIPFCLMRPPCETIQIPDQGFTWLDSNLYADPCAVVDDSMWMRQPADSFDLMVATDGPHGSGRYWTVTIGIAETKKKTPHRGICLETTTIGWRTLRNFNNVPLPWVGDRDEDGLAEIIIWDSFPLHEEASMAEFGLIAWIYEIELAGVFCIDWQLSRELAAEIAAAYHKPVDGINEWIQKLRNDAARNLEMFASEKCTVRGHGN